MLFVFTFILVVAAALVARIVWGAATTLITVVAVVAVIGFLFIFGSKKQGFHDNIAGTAVFRKADVS